MNFDNIPEEPKGRLTAGDTIPETVADALLYTDGSVYPNPGHAGWGFVLFFHRTGAVHEDAGYVGGPSKTNNDAELEAILQGLATVRTLDEYTGDVVVLSDSRWALGGASGAQGRHAAKFKPMWKRLDALVDSFYAEGRKVTYQWVRGHAGNVHNERADTLANVGRVAGFERQIVRGHLECKS